jgi:hypothetical protein
MSAATKMESFTRELIRLGDKFDYREWLRNEGLLSSETTTGAPSAKTATPSVNGSQRSSPSKSIALLEHPKGHNVFVARAVLAHPPGRRRECTEISMSRKLAALSTAYVKVQRSRRRDAIYPYLRRVFHLVRRYRLKRRLRKLLRQACVYADIKYNKRGDAFAVILRCSSDGALDGKTISCMSRALRYVDQTKPRDQPLRSFMKARGGINGCAAEYAAVRRDRCQLYRK